MIWSRLRALVHAWQCSPLRKELEGAHVTRQLLALPPEGGTITANGKTYRVLPRPPA